MHNVSVDCSTFDEGFSMSYLKSILFSLCLFSFCSCTQLLSGVDQAQNTALGAVGGAALGAGVSAVIGATSSTIDTGATMLVGTVAGLGIGAAVGAYYTEMEEESEREENQALIEANRAVILEQEEEIQSLRHSITEETYQLEPDTALSEELYIGPTLGNPYR